MGEQIGFLTLRGTSVILLLLVILSSSVVGLGPPSSFVLDSSPEWYADLLSSSLRLAVRLRLEASSVQASLPTPSNDVQVTFDPSNLPQNEPSIAVNPTSSSNLVAGANDYRLVAVGQSAWAGVYTSFDGGLSWSNKLVPGFPGDVVTNMLSGFDAAGDPSVGFDRTGSVYYGGLAFRIRGVRPTDGSVFVSKSVNGGASFTQTVLVVAGSSKVFHDKPYLGIDRTGGGFNGRIYVSWTRFTTVADIMVSHSSDGGTTFSTPVKVSTGTVNQGSVPVVGPSGELYVVWNDIASDRIMVAKSTNGGVSFSSPVQVSPYVPLPNPLPNSRFRVNNNPTGAVDDTNGNVYVAWPDNRNGNADILVSRSISGGQTWSSPLRVNDDLTTHDQFFPWMTVTGGRVSVDFYDRRLDTGNHRMDVFYTESTDGGLSFSTNIRVTDVSSDPDAVLFGGGESFIGDYIGIASTASSIHPVWADMRNVSPNSPADQDIFTDRLASPSHDLALASLAPDKSVVYEGRSANPVMVTALVRNLGTFTETSVAVRFSANETLIGSANIASLPAGSSMSVSIDWNTNNLVRGRYLLSAEVSGVLGETILTNNSLTDGTLQVRFPGDANGDGKVDIVDLAIVARAYNTTPVSADWNPDADMNNDRIVDIIDLAIVAANYGKVAP